MTSGNDENDRGAWRERLFDDAAGEYARTHAGVDEDVDEAEIDADEIVRELEGVDGEQ